MSNQKLPLLNDFRDEYISRNHFINTLKNIANPDAESDTNPQRETSDEIERIYDWDYFRDRYFRGTDEL